VSEREEFRWRTKGAGGREENPIKERGKNAKKGSLSHYLLDGTSKRVLELKK